MSAALEVSATGAAADAIADRVPELVAEGFAGRLFDRDATLWGPAAEPVASGRLGWVRLHRTSRPLVGEVAALGEELREQGVDEVVLCGTGGAALAAEVICAAAGVELTVLDSTHPDQVLAALGHRPDRLGRTVVVVSGTPGSTLETDTLREVLRAGFVAGGIDPRPRIVVIADPGSQLEQHSRREGFRVVTADPAVGGRFSALSAFGLVPSGLAGVDVEQLLDEAEAVADLLAEDDEANPGLRLGAAIAGTDPLRDKLVLVDEGSGLPGFADWVEQLVAGSTGKSGTGVLPVVVSDSTAPEVTLPPEDATVVRLTGDGDEEDPPGGPTGSEVSVSGSLGAQLLLWEVATAVAGRLLGVSPVEPSEAEDAQAPTRSMLEGLPAPTPPDAVDGAVEIRSAGGGWLGVASTVPDAVRALLALLDKEAGYLAVTAFLDRHGDADLLDVRRRLAIRTRRPVTFGWGPRSLHATGQLHREGPPTGVHLQITGTAAEDLPAPSGAHTLGELVAAQAAAEARLLGERGRPVLRLHVTSPAGLAQVLAAVA